MSSFSGISLFISYSIVLIPFNFFPGSLLMSLRILVHLTEGFLHCFGFLSCLILIPVYLVFQVFHLGCFSFSRVLRLGGWAISLCSLSKLELQRGISHSADCRWMYMFWYTLFCFHYLTISEKFDFWLTSYLTMPYLTLTCMYIYQIFLLYLLWDKDCFKIGPHFLTQALECWE